ncbi:uracil-DNA glycosylase family protein [Sphingobium bisphenolivorans]|uniref:uracil-DNA glycosylase family protein n=1 Tax=Sphingobium bisphenolivorans TaxID=1335760 RepID=UPI0003B362D3|nr:uracil-DNA glycosylase family protein [Sphingobium bisphenolivorans]
MKILDPVVNLWPKTLMRGSMQENSSAVADAYLAWWKLAGVDEAVAEEPVNWSRPAVAKLSAPAKTPTAPQRPQSFEAFLAWLAQDSQQPERRWPGLPILPTGPTAAPLMIITDMPDPADVASGTLFADGAGKLFDAMLRAMGLGRADVHLASLFLSRPPGGMVDAADLSTAAARMSTHVMLAAPKNLLLLGDRTVRALLQAGSTNGENSLQNFNHDGGTVPAFATFHPRLLMRQPAAKAECWRTMQSLIEEMKK